MNRFCWVIVAVVGLVAAPVLSVAQEATKEKAPQRTPDVIYVPTPQAVVEKMLEIADVKPDKVITCNSEDDDYPRSIYLWTTPLKKEKNR